MTNNINNESGKPLLTWTSHPLLDYPRNSVLLIIFILIIAVSLWKIAVGIWEMPLFYYLGMVIFLMSLVTYFIPTYYEIYEDKVLVRYWKIKVEKKFDDFGCYYADKKGVMLGTFKMPRRLDPFRGTSLRFTRNKSEKEELMKILERKIGNKY